MGIIVLGLVKDAYQARGLVRAFEDEGSDPSSPRAAVRAGDGEHAAKAAGMMSMHGAVDIAASTPTRVSPDTLSFGGDVTHATRARI